LFSIAAYNHEEILVITFGVAYGVCHYMVNSFIFKLVSGSLLASMQIYVVKKHMRVLRWEFFSMWIKQMKVIIITLSSITILWTDFYWGITLHNWGSLIGTISTNITILFFLWIDLLEMTIFFRVSIPSFLFILATLQIYGNNFWLDDVTLWTFQGHILGVLDIQNVAWSQIVVLAFLGLKAAVTDPKHKKFYFIEKNDKRGTDYTTKGWILVKSDIALLITYLVYVGIYRVGAKIG